MASNTDKINATDLQELLGSNLTSDFKMIVFTTDGETYQMSPTGISCINSLDTAYDGCGSGAGREIIADSGAVKISGEDGLLVTGTFGSGDAAEISGAGTRMFFNPAKAAFRAGTVLGTEWDDANIGAYSTAIGKQNTSSGESSFSGGDEATASGYSSFAFGSGVTEASGDNSFAIGEGATASDELAIAMGSSATASGFSSTAIGTSPTSSGNSSTAIGSNIESKSFSETAIGLFNTDYTPTSTSSWESTDRLLVIGNGQSSRTRADALIIQKNGNLTMPTTTGAFSPPVMTTTQRDALTPTAGMMVYNSTTNKHQGYDGTTWNDFY